MDKFTPISDLNLDTQSINTLIALGVNTIGDIFCLERICSILEQPHENYLKSNIIPQWDTLREQLSIRTQNGLKKLKIDTMDAFLALTRKEFLSVQSIGIKSWNEVRINQKQINNTLSFLYGEKKLDTQEITLQNFPLFDGSGIGNSSIPERFYPEVATENLILSSRIITKLNKMKLNTLKSVLMVNPNRLLKLKNFGIKSLMKLRHAIQDYLDFRNNFNESLIDTGESYQDFIEILCGLCELPHINIQLLMDRLGTISGKTRTLEDLADEYGYTRERIRQFLQDTVKQVKKNYRSNTLYISFQNTIRNILETFCGIISSEELSEQLKHFMNWNGPVSKESLQEFFKLFISENGISLQNGNIICKHPCRDCRVIVERLFELLETSPSGILPLSSLAEPCFLCNPTPERGCPSSVGLRYSQSFFAELSNRVGLFCDDDNIYAVYAWALRHGGLNRKVEAILDMLKIAATPEEVWKNLQPYLGHFVPIERIHQALINAEDVYIWGRRNFIHKNHINIDKNILASLENLLLEKLLYLPFVALHGIFQDFRITLEKAGIPNEYALSTVVALYIKNYHVDRYRYVYMDKSSKSTSIDHYVEQWIQSQEGEVKRSDLEKWMIDQVAVRESVIQLSLGRLDNVLATRKGFLIHIDNAGISSDKLAPLYRWVQSALEQQNHIGINKLYKEHQILCIQLNITSKKMLYDVMRYYFSRDFDFTRFPHICKQEQSTFNTLGEAILQYIKEKKTIVAIDDCVQYFETKGYSPSQLRARLHYLPAIYPYYPGCIVHEDTIGWDKDKANQLNQILSQSYYSRLNLGYLMGDLEEVYNLHEDRLPKLHNDMNWTGELLYAIATRFDDIKIIGNAKRAYSVTSYEKAIHNLTNLIVVVLCNQFGGCCSREKMNQWMQDNGVIYNKLSPRMFTAPPDLVVTDYEYLWKGEVHV